MEEVGTTEWLHVTQKKKLSKTWENWKLWSFWCKDIKYYRFWWKKLDPPLRELSKQGDQKNWHVGSRIRRRLNYWFVNWSWFCGAWIKRQVNLTNCVRVPLAFHIANIAYHDFIQYKKNMEFFFALHAVTAVRLTGWLLITPPPP